jgi:MFS family permease
MTEGGSQKRRGFLGGWPQLGSPAGLVLATLIFSATTASVSSEEFPLWGWRLPFLLSIILVVVGFVARISMPETPVFRQAQRANAIARSPLFETLKTQWQEV